eukprot:10388473-Lingulodinium_polyedra.AAC.1
MAREEGLDGGAGRGHPIGSQATFAAGRDLQWPKAPRGDSRLRFGRVVDLTESPSAFRARL